MKKGILALLALVLLGAGCAGQQVREIYSVKEFAFSMSFPEEFDIVTHEVGDVDGLSELGIYPHSLDMWLRGPQTEEYLDIAPVIRLLVSPEELLYQTQYEYEVSVRPDGKLILGERSTLLEEGSGNISISIHGEGDMNYVISVSAANEEIADDIIRDISAHFEILPTVDEEILEADQL